MEPAAMDVSLKGLRTFVVLAEELHFGRAAERLGIAQPAVSQQLGRLEDALGVRLVERRVPRPALTAAGAALLPEARRTLAAQRRALDAVKSAARGQTGELALGVTATVAPERLITLLRRHAERHPGIRVTVREHPLDRLLAAIAEGEIAAGATTGFAPPPAPDGITFTVLAREGLDVALHHAHPLTGRARLDLAELTGERFAVIARDGLTARSFGVHGICERQGFEPDVFAEVSDTAMQLAMVATGAAIAVTAHSAARSAPPEVGFVPLVHDQPLLTLLAHPNTPRPDPALRSLLDLAAQTGPAPNP